MTRSLLVFLALCLSVSAFATDGTRMVGFDAKTIGRGGTTIGFFDSPTLMMTNPAGISFMKSSVLDANFSLMVPNMHFQNNLNSVDGQTNYFPLPGLAYVHHAVESPFTWGVGAFTQGGMGADWKLTNALYGSTQQEYHSKLAVMQGGASVAYKLAPNFSVGATAHLVYSMLEFKMPYSLSPSAMAGAIMPGLTFGQMFAAPPPNGFGYQEVTASANMTDLSALGFSGKIGLAYKVNDAISLGLAYTSPTTLNYKGGNASMDMTAQLNDAFGKAVQGYMMQNPTSTAAQAQGAVMAQFAGMGIDMSKGVSANYDLGATLKLPQSIGFGVSVAASPVLRLAFEAEWINWKNGFDVMALSLSGGQNPNINKMMGNSGSFPIDFPMNWKDSYSVRIGGEYDLSSAVTVRAGYAYGSNPVPESTIFPVFPAIVENDITLGATVAVSEAFRVNGAYEIGLNKSLTASSQSLVADEYNNSVSQLGENIFHIGLSWIVN